MGASTFQFNLEVHDNRLEGPVVRRTSPGPRGNSGITLRAVLTRQD
jgi:hypothetical protein